MKNKESPAPTKQLGIEKKIYVDDNIIISQQQRLLNWLREKSITTIQARHELNILMPGARVYDLRHKFGHNIQTVWVEDCTPEGKKHRVARYFLKSGKWTSEGDIK